MERIRVGIDGIARFKRLCYGPRLASAGSTEAGFLMTCGRGGTGRRAALRSLWPKGRGSSSLLDRTITRYNRYGVAGAVSAAAIRAGARGWIEPSRTMGWSALTSTFRPRSTPIFAAAAELAATRNV